MESRAEAPRAVPMSGEIHTEAASLGKAVIRRAVGPLCGLICLLLATSLTDARSVALVRNGPVMWVEEQQSPPADQEYNDSDVKVLRHGRPATLAAHRRNLAVSANGHWMLTQDADLAGATCAVRLTDLVANRERVLESCGEGDQNYTWAPRGEYLTVSDSDPNSDLNEKLVVNARTGITRRLRGGSTEWSPDGRRLLVLGPRRARVLNVVTGHWSPACGRGDEGEWSPAGRMVLVSDAESRNRSTALCTRSGRRVSRLRGVDYSWARSPSRLVHAYTTGSGARSRDDFAVINRFGRVRWRVRNAFSPTWTSRGRLAYLRPVGDNERASLWVARSDGRARHRIGMLPADFPPQQTELAWSPDGRSILASWFDTESEFHVPEDSAIASISRRGLRHLEGSFVEYSPDGRRMLLIGDRLAIADTRGRHLHRISGAPARHHVVQDARWPSAPR
jgi:hypothetical protein